MYQNDERCYCIRSVYDNLIFGVSAAVKKPAQYLRGEKIFLLHCKGCKHVNHSQTLFTITITVNITILIVMFMYSYCLYALFFISCFHRANWHSPTILTEVSPCFFLSCKANTRVYLAKTGHGPYSS
jgi:hypothetical protein